MVTMLPMVIMNLITSVAFTDIFCASSATVLVSETAARFSLARLFLDAPAFVFFAAARFGETRLLLGLDARACRQLRVDAGLLVGVGDAAFHIGAATAHLCEHRLGLALRP